MTAIAKTLLTPSVEPSAAPPLPPAQAISVQAASVQWRGLAGQIVDLMAQRGAHAARTVVLLPFYQLQATARSETADVWATGFTPRWETTKSWSQRIGCFVQGSTDLRFDAAHDSLAAASYLGSAGLADKQAMLVPALVATAQQLGSVVAAVAPAHRAAWAVQARAAVVQGLNTNPLAYEAAVARIALEWALASSYETDVLFEAATGAQIDCLVIVEGLQANPLALALAAHWQAVSSVVAFSIVSEASKVQIGGQAEAEFGLHAGVQKGVRASIHIHSALDAHDEADRAAACVLRHVAQQRTPVALAAVDRVLTRRISATLALHGLAVLDETGWKLSTTRAAAALMALLRAAHWSAGEDALLDWLKHTALGSDKVDALEKAFRGLNTPVSHIDNAQAAIQFIAKDGESVQVKALLKTLVRPRPIAQWLASVQDVMRTCGMWGAWVQDEAGADCAAALLLLTPQDLAHHSALMGLPEFTAWVQAALEAASFKARWADQTEALVTVLPLAQVLARPFAALVLAGADEQRLPRSPEPVGSWSAVQRIALGLPSREALEAEQLRVWQCALNLPHVDVLWRQANGEQVMQPSVLVLGALDALVAPGLLNRPSSAREAIDPRINLEVQVQPCLPPQPCLKPSGALRVQRLSASAYDDLRTCPYRYFALRLMGLHDAPELDAEVDKRDFGSWLHAVLADFHQRRKAQAATGAAIDDRETGNKRTGDAALLDQCALDQQTPGSGFIPFAASWPQVRTSYLAWLASHEVAGWKFEVSELSRERVHAGVQLIGRLDRVDRLSRGPTAGSALVLDYKTDSSQTSKDRVREPLEDTQLAFYAALLDEDDIEAAYVNISEKLTQSTPQPDLMTARDALLVGITADVERIHAGHAMPALGEGKACDYCAARGLCRKDFWTV